MIARVKTNRLITRSTVILFIGIFALIGLVLLLNSRAAISTTNIGFEVAKDLDCANITGGNTEFTRDSSKSYDGAYSAKATFSGGRANAYARCVVPTSLITGDEVWYGAAFFLPTGFTDSMQNQVDLMRWDNYSLNDASQDWGGLIIQNKQSGQEGDKKARLKRFNTGTDYIDLSTPFKFPENRWVWVEVYQKLSPNVGEAKNEVYLDGVLQSSSNTPNTYGREITRIRYGLVAIGAGSQTNPLNLWVDRATISPNKVGPIASSPPTPPPSTLPGDVDGNKVVDIDDLSLLLINWKKNYPQADFVKDNIIDIDDLSILLVNWGKKLNIS